MAIYASAPAVGVIDQNNALTFSWTPNPDGSQSFSQYAFWNITVDSTTFVAFPVGGATLGTQTFIQTLTAGAHTITMQGFNSFTLTQVQAATPSGGEATYTGTFSPTIAVGSSVIITGFTNSGNNGTYVVVSCSSTQLVVTSGSAVNETHAGKAALAVTNAWLTNNNPAVRSFPDVLTASDVILSLSSVLLGQTLTVTLSNIYTGADQWQVLWPDNTSTGWLPLSANVVAKSFTVPGAQNIVIQTRRDSSASQFNPPASLIRQVTQQIFVVDQQQTGTSTSTGGLTGDLGIGGTQGFEIVDASSPAAVPNPWEIIARGLVRDTVTNELKLLVATTRFSNASSLLGTMAIDVFPIEGRPHSEELIQPVFELTTTSQTESVLVKIATATLPNLIVGKSVSQALGGQLAMTTKPGTGIDPFLWTSIGLPPGVTISSSGVINGTPTALGAFNPTFAVQDSSIPFSIDETTLSLTVITDLFVQIATGQKDANNATLAPLGTTLGIAQVGTPYKVQMQVGNINPTATTPGGLAPYTWSIPAGALPIGLAIDPNTGIISGVPCTYNSQQDYGVTYTAIIQVTDAIGAKATQTYTMSLIAAAFQFGPIDQPNIFQLQEFNLDVPVWGGQSPYGSLVFQPTSADANFYGTAALVDGRVEVPVGSGSATTPGGFPTTLGGGHQFSLTLTDSSGTPKTLGPVPISYTVNSEISDIRVVQATPGHYWDKNDNTGITMPIAGNFTGYTLNATVLTLTSVAGFSGSPATTVYTGTIGSTSFTGQFFTVQGFTNAANNGVFQCTSSTPTTLTLSNAFGVAETHAGKAIENVQPSLSNGIGVAIDSSTTPPQIDATGPASAFQNSQLRIPLVLTQSGTAFGSISREFTFMAHDDTQTHNDIGLFTCYPRPFIVNVDTVGLNPRKPYFNADATVPATISGLKARVQVGSVLPPGLSLDQNTGLIYGLLVGMSAGPSIIEYVDTGGTIHGTVTINWTTYLNAFSPSNTGGVINASMGLPGTITLYNAPPGVTVVNPTIVYPLSNNIAVGVPGTTIQVDNTGAFVQLVGTPSEAGYFDVWLQVQNSSNLNQFSYIYNRIVVQYAKPMIILTQSLPTFSNQAFSFQLQGFGGIPPYAPSAGEPTAGWSQTGAPTGFTIDQTTGILSAAPTSWNGSPFNFISGTTSFQVTFTLTDQRGAQTTSTLTLAYNNSLRILTTNVPIIAPGVDYSFTMSAAGGVPPYKWQLVTGSGALPTGIFFDGTNTYSGFDNVDTQAGQFFGAWPGSPSYTPTTFTIDVQDSATTVASGNFLVQTGTPAFTLNIFGVGTIDRGVPYQGTISLFGTVTPPVTWQIAPTNANPEPMLDGLVLQANSSNQGLTAVISGTYSGVPHQIGILREIVGNGTTAQVYLFESHGFTAPYTLNLTAAAAAIAGTTSYTGTISGWPTGQTPVGQTFVVTGFSNSPNNGTFLCTGQPSSTVLILANASGVVETGATATAATHQTVTWAGTAHFDGTYTVIAPIDDTSFTITSSANFTEQPVNIIGATNTANLWKTRIIATDASANSASFPVPLNTGTDLTVLTNGLPNATVGGSYNFTLTASGGVPAYTWSLETFGDSLAGTGLSLNASTGAITGSATGIFTKNLVFRVTDQVANIPNIARQNLQLVSQASGLTILTNAITPIISGVPYSFTLSAGGSVNTPYTWTIVSGTLPAGVTMSSTGVLTGSSTAVGYSQPIVFKVTDTIAANVSKSLTVTVSSGLALVAGPDFIMNTSVGNLGLISTGQVTSINPRPNLSFFVVATGVQSTSPASMTVTTGNPNIAGTVTSISGGNAQIQLTGSGFANGISGTNSVSVSVTDSGTTVTQTFTWVIYSNGTLRFGQTLPTQTTTP